MLIYLAAGPVAVVEAMAKTKSEKEKANGRGRSGKKKKVYLPGPPFSPHYALRLDESPQSQFIAKIMGTSLTFLQKT